MRLSCVHCGKDFTITAEQLGTRGRCPHCRAAITLPKADDGQATEQAELEPPSRILEHVLSGMGSCIIHLILLIILGLIQWGSSGIGPGKGEEVFIGELPFEKLTDQADDQLQSDQSTASEQQLTDDNLEEIPTPEMDTSQEFADAKEITVGIGSAFAQGNEFSKAQAGSSGGGGSGDFQGLIQQLRRDGLDIVIMFDSTGSMSGEINQVKDQIEKIGTILFKLVPKTRVAICTYRDFGDEFVVKGQPLTDDLQQIQNYLEEIDASGGGDEPEAVEEGLKWAVTKNKFRPKARKVILIFGDAPPHNQHISICKQIADGFHSQQGGVVSTVTCRSTSRLLPFIEISNSGRGEAFLTRNEREIMTQLIVLVFGSKHREKVLEAFELLD